jgi:hypothetical protein
MLPLSDSDRWYVSYHYDRNGHAAKSWTSAHQRGSLAHESTVGSVFRGNRHRLIKVLCAGNV